MQDLQRRAFDAFSNLQGSVLGLVGSDFTVLWAAESYARIFGLDAVGRNVLDLLHPDDHAFAGNVLLHEASAHLPVGFSTSKPGEEFVPRAADLRLLTADGSWRTCTVRSENRFGDPTIEALVLRIECHPDRSGVGKTLDLIALGKPIDDIAQWLADFIPLDFNETNQHCVAAIWFDGQDVRFASSRADLPTVSTQAMVKLSLSVLPEAASTVETITSTNIENISSELAPEVRIARDLGFDRVWASLILDEKGKRIGAIAVISDDPFDLHLRREMNVSIGINLFKLALMEHRRRAQLTHAAISDPLTGLRNRTGIKQALAEFTEQNRYPIGLLIADLDGFKGVNDTYGHEAGDTVISVTGQRLLDACGSSQFAGRLGGDEFVVVFEASTDEGQVGAEVERFSKAINRPILLKRAGTRDVVLPISASIGFAVASNAGDLDDLMRRADQRLYAQKSNSRERPFESSPEIVSRPMPVR
jgi:diguanylate cyclase (GGDEF)-like protein